MSMEIGQVPAYKRWSNRYSYAFKLEVIEAFQSGQMSQRQVTRKYGVHRTTIVTWEKKYGNPEKNYLRMEEKTPQQELAELRAALKAANEENKTLKYVMRVIQEEYGEGLVKKYLPGLQLKKPQIKIKKSK
jgi:transposase